MKAGSESSVENIMLERAWTYSMIDFCTRNAARLIRNSLSPSRVAMGSGTNSRLTVDHRLMRHDGTDIVLRTSQAHPSYAHESKVELGRDVIGVSSSKV